VTDRDRALAESEAAATDVDAEAATTALPVFPKVKKRRKGP
jgi:hypothetical protein